MDKKVKNAILIGLIILSIIMILSAFEHARYNKKIDYESNYENNLKDNLDNNNDNNNFNDEHDNDDNDDANENNNNENNLEDEDEEVMKQQADNFNLSITSTKDSKLSISYIIFIGIWNLILSLSLTYLIMSEFNSKKVFVNSDKMIIYILSNVVITEILTYITTYIGNMII